MTTVVTGPASARSSPSSARSPRRVLGWLAVFALAWLLPAAAYLTHAGIVVPLVVVAGLMSLQRGGGGGFDRLLPSLAQLFGALCLAGLLFSVWPWQLHPVAIGGTALSGLVLLALVTGRRPRLPGRWRARDGVLLTVLGAVGLLALEPFALRDAGGRLGLLVPGEDMSRHFLIYDMIGRVGGYAWMSPEESLSYASAGQAPGIRNYPQGVHFTYAVLDRFIRSSATSAADGVVAMNVLVWLCLATFVVLALAVLWAARRIAGPGPDAARLLPALAVVAAWLAFGDPVAIFIRGFPNELVGLSLAAVLTAIVARPLRDRGEQLATVALLLVGISFSYHLFLPYAVLLAALWAARERLWRRPLGWVVAVLLVAPVLVTPVLNAHAASARQLTLAGTAQVNDRPATVVLVLLALAVLLCRGGRRSPVRATAAVALGLALAIMLGLGAFQLITIGRTIYYYEKTMHLLIVVALVGLGGLARLLPRRASGGLVRRTVPGLALVLPLVLVLVALGGTWHTRPGSNGLRLALGVERGSPAGARDAMLITRRYPDGGGMMNVSLMSTPYRNLHATLYGAAMQRTYRYGDRWFLWLDPRQPPKTLADLEAVVTASPVPVRLFVYDPEARFLVLDPARPVRASQLPGGKGSAFGDPAALSNVQAAEHLAAKYPGKVHVERAVPPNE